MFDRWGGHSLCCTCGNITCLSKRNENDKPR
jgi:hypothetical protein